MEISTCKNIPFLAQAITIILTVCPVMPLCFNLLLELFKLRVVEVMVLKM